MKEFWEPEEIKNFISCEPGQQWHAVMNDILKEITNGMSIPYDFMRLHEPGLSFEDRVLLELRIELHLGWGLYRQQRNRPG